MKQIKNFIVALCALCGISSCSDMLENDNTRQVFDPALDAKTDSVFYALGVLQGMQQLADQYVFLGEMRGDLTATTAYTDKNLRQLANFTATATNKYDSAYVYYRVINNCNYYIAHRDTTLRTGADYVAMKEYVAIKAIRAWAYLQLGRNYEKVLFCTEPLTSISQIDNGHFPELTLTQIVDRLAPDLEQYTGYSTPNYGSTPSGSSFAVSKIFIPVDVVLGDMYLETEQFDKAASHYVTYLTQVATSATRHTAYMECPSTVEKDYELPSDWSENYNRQSAISGTNSWSSIFSTSNHDDIISYIPFPGSAQEGVTTILPKSFGFDYYANNPAFMEEIQITPSSDYVKLSDSQDYYYFSTVGNTSAPVIKSAKLGDTRLVTNLRRRVDAQTEATTEWVTKYVYPRVILYRNTTVMLHLAEAFNRLGMYDAAFAILKDGISTVLQLNSASAQLNDTAYYVRPQTLQALSTTYPLLSDANVSKFRETRNGFGVHSHGCGFVFDHYASEPRFDLSPYQLGPVVGQKLQAIAATFPEVTVGSTAQDSINAVEDLLCDEYALELAFEGSRYADLLRLARHKNAQSPAGYPANFGFVWLKNKLNGRWDESKQYLPFN